YSSRVSKSSVENSSPFSTCYSSPAVRYPFALRCFPFVTHRRSRMTPVLDYSTFRRSSHIYTFYHWEISYEDSRRLEGC
ncbi:unnamed protein product, partial [Oikopleura dioica]